MKPTSPTVFPLTFSCTRTKVTAWSLGAAALVLGLFVGMPACRADSADLTELIYWNQIACSGNGHGVYADVNGDGTSETFVVFNVHQGEAHGRAPYVAGYGTTCYYYTGIDSDCGGAAPWQTGRFSVWFVNALAPGFNPTAPATWQFKSVPGVRLFADSDDYPINSDPGPYRQVNAYTEHHQGGTLVGSYAHPLGDAVTRNQACEFTSGSGIKEIYLRSDSSGNGIESFIILASGSTPAGGWINLGSAGAGSERDSHTAVWTGSEMIVWGGRNSSTYLNDGGRYNPATGTWTPLPATGAPTGRYRHAAVWTGSEMIIWGGWDGLNFLTTGARYNPTLNTWTAVSTTGAPAARYGHIAIWTGSEMVVWGGWGAANYLSDGGRYNPTLNTWSALNTNGAPVGRQTPATVWTGSEMIVWGGYGWGAWRSDGGRYNPTADTWTAVATTGAPAKRSDPKAIWTGTEMIVWGGGFSLGHDLNTGGRYNPGNDTWTAVPTNGAPSGRRDHTVIWTGGEMIVWGGTNLTCLNDGGRYSPAANRWSPLTTTGAPAARHLHTAVWTGSKMLVFGGSASSYYSDLYAYTPEAPPLRIFPTGPNAAVVAWPYPSAGFGLQQSTALSPASWTSVTDTPVFVGSEWQVTSSTATGTKSYRLRKP